MAQATWDHLFKRDGQTVLCLTYFTCLSQVMGTLKSKALNKKLSKIFKINFSAGEPPLANAL